jgi:L-alanine-DL-glutamate epimerase-like enolase superfamily enzyme
MSRHLAVEVESFPIAGSFTIARGSKTQAVVVTCLIGDGRWTGRGECVPYARYGESVEGVRAAIEQVRPAVAAGATREALLALLPGGAARNAVDCALWDLEAKQAGRRAWEIAEVRAPEPAITAYTLSLAEPAQMAAEARRHAHRPLLKIKLGRGGDIERMRAIRDAAPESRLIVDANEGWGEDVLAANLAVAAELGVALVEQPLPAGHDALLADIPHPVPICADESFHGEGDPARLSGLYDAINIKLDKTGGLTAALAVKRKAQELGMGIMVGCMVGTSLGMAPALLLVDGAAFVDLDGPLLLARDREPGLRYEGSLVHPSDAALWG